MRSSSIKKDSNWVYLLLALCVALILWYTVNAREQIERLVDVRIDYKGLPHGLVVLSGQINKTQVRLRGPRELFRSMESRDLSHTMDLSDVKKGVNVIPLDRQNNNRGLRMYQVLEVIPSHLTLDVDTLGTKEVPVVMRLRNEPAPADVQVHWLSVAPSTVSLKGPESVLAGIDVLPVEAQLDTFAENASHVVEAPVITPSGLEVRPSSVTAEYTVSVNRRNVTMLRQLGVEGTGEQCYPQPVRVRLRVAIPEQYAGDEAYLEQIRAVINIAGIEHPESSDLPIQVHLPAGARLESIAPAMGRVQCQKPSPPPPSPPSQGGTSAVTPLGQ